MVKPRRILSFVLSFIMLLAILPVNAFAAVKAPAKPTGLSATSTTTTVTVKWKKVSGATGYTLYKYNTSTKKYSSIKTTTATSYKVPSLKAGTTYVYAVKSYKTVKKKKYYSGYSAKLTTSTKPAAVTGLKATSVLYNGFTASWTKVTGATGYKVQYSTKKDFSSGVTTKTTTSTSLKITSLKEKTKYYVRAYAYRTVDKKTYTSSASTVINTTTKEKYATTKSTVSEATAYQSIDGFGCSACWWGQRIGRWEKEGLTPFDDYWDRVWTPMQTENVLKYLYDKNEGIGLNIYRYNVGTDSYTQPLPWDKWKKTEGFIDTFDKETGEITFDFSKDKSAQNTLSVARNLAGDDLRVTLFANSPPVQMTVNGLSYCDYNKGATAYAITNQNLDVSNYQNYANYLVGVADHFVEDGYRVIDVSPVNEPQFLWAIDENGYIGQEGCHYQPLKMVELFEVCADTAQGKPYKFSMFDSGKANGEKEALGQYLERLMKSEKIKNYYNDLSFHSYWVSADEKTNSYNYVTTKYPSITKFRSTEYCQMNYDENNGMVFGYNDPVTSEWKRDWYDEYKVDIPRGMTIRFGLQLAKNIYNDMTLLNVSEFDWWTGVTDINGATDGLVYVDYMNPNNIETSKRLWCMGNYSKFIDEGAKRVKVTEAQASLLSSAYKNPDGSLAIVYVNMNEKATKVNVSASGYKTFSAYTTSADYDLEMTQSGAYSIDNAVNIPALSVVTVVLNK